MSVAGNNEFLRVAFDASALKPRYNHSGIQVYTRNLLDALRCKAQPRAIEIRPFLPHVEDLEVKDLEVKDLGTTPFAEGPGFRPRYSSLMRFDRLWRYGGATAAAFLNGADMMLNPNGASLPISTLLPTVTVIHDLTPMVMPCFPRRIASLLRFLLMRSAKSSAAIITVSENSRQDIVRICSISPSKVHVVHEGYDSALFSCASPKPALLQELCVRFGINRPYILHHGAIQPRKNLPRLIAAYRHMLTRNPKIDLDLVLAGPLAWQHEETVNAAKADKNDRSKLVLTGALSDHDLSLLVRGASLEVIPSLSEGFCLPMVEAMACGVPTIASNSSCLPEISGGVLHYFDPYSVEAMAACMEEVLLSHDLQVELARRGRERAQKFSWDLCAAETLGVLEQVARRREVHSRAAGVAL
ncbi:MAG TPA: glycosyltransferase family 1 protein [Candidatus Dormibacteraeota bacterium]|nr:glycosyltransferase family 1 protein [Candidatus Dormibacteraeota bacterium]